MVLASACGRIHFDPLASNDGGDGGEDAAIAMCTGAASATLPPASGSAFLLVRAWGAAPNAPAGTPTRDTAELVWGPIGPAYTVIRSVCGGDPDPTTTTPCTPTTTASCVACTSSTSTDCIDANAPPAPTRARYQVLVTGELAVDPTLTVDIAVPPPNMVLVHRASVNREMCDVLGSPTDPTQHWRCPTTGPGAVPLRAHPDSPDLGLPAGFYDFGYDLFVDRWETACNWTHAADGGMCGAGSASGDCTNNSGIETGGVVGNVFYSTYDGGCYVMTAAGWQETHLLAATDPVSAALSYTNDPGPGHDRPPLAYLDDRVSSALCNQISVPSYGTKRSWRLREYVAAAAFPRLPGDPGAMSLSSIMTIEGGLDHPANHGCNVATHDGVAATGFRSGDELSRDVMEDSDPAGDADTFVIGSVATSACVSRYGVQDMIGNEDETVSDEFASCGATTTCVGIASPVDAGNTDLAGFTLDGVIGVGPAVDSQDLDTASLMVVPLAMPLAAGAPFGVPPEVTQTRGDMTFLYETTPDHPRMGIAGGTYSSGPNAGRFETDFGGDPDGANVDVTWGTRCVVAAVPR